MRNVANFLTPGLLLLGLTLGCQRPFYPPPYGVSPQGSPVPGTYYAPPAGAIPGAPPISSNPTPVVPPGNSYPGGGNSFPGGSNSAPFFDSGTAPDPSGSQGVPRYNDPSSSGSSGSTSKNDSPYFEQSQFELPIQRSKQEYSASLTTPSPVKTASHEDEPLDLFSEGSPPPAGTFDPLPLDSSKNPFPMIPSPPIQQTTKKVSQYLEGVVTRDAERNIWVLKINPQSTLSDFELTGTPNQLNQLVSGRRYRISGTLIDSQDAKPGILPQLQLDQTELLGAAVPLK